MSPRPEGVSMRIDADAAPGADDVLAGWLVQAGIAPGFDDMWGGRHEAPEAGLRSLLVELGIGAADAGALAAARAADADRLLAPVLVASDEAADITANLRIPASTRRVHWRLDEETGGVREGTVDVPAGGQTGAARVALALALGTTPSAGYHRLAVRVENAGAVEEGDALLVVAPGRCYRPPALQGDGRVWGPAVQLYALRSARNWGIGDFTDLARLAADFAARGAGIVGLNPLHALFPHRPAQISPYSPSSRLQLAVLYIDVEAVPEFATCAAARALVSTPAFRQRLAALRAAPTVDHAGVAACKFEVLALLHAHFRESVPRAAFDAWRAERGDALRLHATFEALQAHRHAAHPQEGGWAGWPAPLRDPRSAEVRAFQAAHAERIDWFEYLQWQADRQLGAVAAAARARGDAVGLYLDLAVSVDRNGSDAWAHAALYAPGAAVGAPPDEVNLNGQDWGLPPFKPRALLDDRLAFFRETLRACMRHAGALRIDHVMGLMRLYWIPPGLGAKAGAYVHYPLEELMAVVALESARNRCMIIGEDLGTVADEMRAALSLHEVLSYRLLYFERGERGVFNPPAQYPREALVAVGTHDLPTFAGWWSGHDIEVRRRLGLYPDAGVLEDQVAGRAADRVRLLQALRHAGWLPEGLATDGASPPPLSQALVEAVHAFAASAPSRVMVMQLEDVLQLADQANMPGTVDEHPNWRQKLPVAVEMLAADERVRGVCDVVARIRPCARMPGMAADAGPAPAAIVPRATYRLQLHQDFPFDAATAILPYLQRLGVSHVYCSPVLRARAGSRHGYDVVAHDEINPELGGRAAFDRFSAEARALGLGLVLDIVPNHMGIGAENRWWMDVLAHGEASLHAAAFDIDWTPLDPGLRGRVLLPVLGERLGAVLAQGQLTVAFDREAGRFEFRYWDHRFPIDPRTTVTLLRRAGKVCAGPEGESLRSLADAFAHLPAREDASSPSRQERARDAARLALALGELVRSSPAADEAVGAALAEANAPAAIDALHEAQAYRLAWWRVASDEINYRRFFDVNDLAALRMEDPAVFDAAHGLVLDLLAAGQVDGLRLDHTDGMHDPAQYFERLQQAYARRRGVAPPARDAAGRLARPLYVVAEKIIGAAEELPDGWALQGDTGYRFASLVNGVLVDTRAESRLTALWRRFTGDATPFPERARRGKLAVATGSLAAELASLAHRLHRIARERLDGRDLTLGALREALAAVAACLPVYRTYLVSTPSAADRRVLEEAVAAARDSTPDADPAVFDFVGRALLAEAPPEAGAAAADEWRRFAMRFQQFSSPVMAKGVEDTAFYGDHRLAALNEVGGDPAIFGARAEDFHAANADRAARWPHAMLATSTHDTKRSEDVRCRLDVLSELPAAWRLCLRRLSRALEQGDAGTAAAPSRADQSLLAQTVLGTLPAGGLSAADRDTYRDRIERYMVKAAREAKTRTDWIRPDQAYEASLVAAVGRVLAPESPWLDGLQRLADALARAGAFNSLALVTLKNTAPGVPDLYQGNESMDLSLVDPDNRRPVDYGRLRALLDEFAGLQAGHDVPKALRRLAATPQDGRLKLWVTWRLLQWRREHAALYRDGGYQALGASGTRARHVVAFVRDGDGGPAITATGRFFARLPTEVDGVPAGAPAWGDTRLDVPALADGSRWRNGLTGEIIRVEAGGIALSSLFATLPVAVLAPEPAP